jgi:hypothetical protein
MKGTAQTEFLKLALKDRAAINDVQRSLPTRVWRMRSDRVLLNLVNKFQLICEKDNQRIRDGYKFFLQYLEAINAHADGKLAEAPVIQPPRVLVARTDTENQLLHQFILNGIRLDRVRPLN